VLNAVIISRTNSTRSKKAVCRLINCQTKVTMWAMGLEWHHAGLFYFFLMVVCFIYHV